MAFTRTWDETSPLGTAAANTLETIVQNVKTDVRERVPPALTLTAGAEAANAIIITVQANDINATAWAETRLLFRVWVSAANYGSPIVDVDGSAILTSVVSSGNEIESFGAHQFLVVSGATGLATITLTITGAATLYVMAELDGKVYSSGAVTFAA